MRMESTVVAIVVMVLKEMGMVGGTIISKAAMNSGMSNFVFVVYYNTLGFLLFLPFFIFHISRNSQPPLTFAILCRCFLIGTLGKGMVLFGYIGIGYSSPALFSALGNLTPIFTFVLLIAFRMENTNFRSSSTRAICLGTIVAVSGAVVMTLYKGASLLSATSSPSTYFHPLLAGGGDSNWIFGGLLCTIGCIFGALWYILQTTTVKLYPDQNSIVFFYLLFGTMQSAVIGMIIERNNPSSWTLRPDMEMVAVVYSAVSNTLISNNVTIWCLNKKGPLFVSIFQPLTIVMSVGGGILFLGDELYLGSVFGSIIIAVGFYSVIWGQAKEMEMVEDTVSKSEASDPNTPLLQNYDNTSVA